MVYCFRAGLQFTTTVVSSAQLLFSLYVSVSYNTPSRDMGRIYARCTRARSEGGVHIYEPNPEEGML